MTIISVSQFNAKPQLDIKDELRDLAQALQAVDPNQHSVLGTVIQDRNIIQITSEWDHPEDSKKIETTSKYKQFLRIIHDVGSQSAVTFRVSLNAPALGSQGPATANVVEYVQSWFPLSRITPEFKRQIQDDFIEFDRIFSQDAAGNLGWVSGWGTEEQKRDDLSGEMDKCFFVVRGWETVEQFERSVQTETYKTAIPLLLAWNAPFKMVCVSSFQT